MSPALTNEISCHLAVFSHLAYLTELQQRVNMIGMRMQDILEREEVEKGEKEAEEEEAERGKKDGRRRERRRRRESRNG